MQCLVKFVKEYKPAIPGKIYGGIQTCNAWSNLLGMQACNTWSNLQSNTSMQCLVKFAEEYKHAITGQIY